MLCSILGRKWRPRYCFLLTGLYSEEKLRKETDKTYVFTNHERVLGRPAGADAERGECWVRKGTGRGAPAERGSAHGWWAHATAALPVFTGK